MIGTATRQEAELKQVNAILSLLDNRYKNKVGLRLDMAVGTNG